MKAIYPDNGNGDREAHPEAVPGLRPETEDDADLTSLTREVDGQMLALHREEFAGVTGVRPAANPDAGQWLLRSDVTWWDLVRYGPPGFEVYVRIAFSQDPDAEGEDLAIRVALATLATFTATPGSGYAAVWEGWQGRVAAPRAPRVEIPNRAMLLFSGPVEVLRDAPALAWYGVAQGYQQPHLVWPEDQAWCLACEVDEEIEFTVGCSGAASQALARALPGAVRRVQYVDPAPLYHKPA